MGGNRKDLIDFKAVGPISHPLNPETVTYVVYSSPVGVQSYSWIEHGMTKCTSFRDTPLIRVPNQCLCHRYTILGLFDLDKFCYWLLRGQTLLPKSLYILPDGKQKVKYFLCPTVGITEWSPKILENLLDPFRTKGGLSQPPFDFLQFFLQN